MADISVIKTALKNTSKKSRPPDLMDDKRKYPRINKSLPVKLSNCESDILTQTKNISANGAFCSVDQPIELMTKLKIVILFPFSQNNKTVIKKITCEGVVVRQEYIKDNGRHSYCLGIYFNEIKDKDKKLLLSYTNHFESNDTIE